MTKQLKNFKAQLKNKNIQLHCSDLTFMYFFFIN